MVARARVTHGEFEEEFSTTEDCVLAAYDQGVQLVSSALSKALKDERRWLSRVRLGVVVLLRFLDSEPAWARLLAIGDTPSTRERRERSLARLAVLLERGSPSAPVGDGESGDAQLTLPHGLMAELVVGGAFSVIHARIVEREGELSALAPALTSMIVLPYLGAEVAKQELRRSPVIAQHARPRGGAAGPRAARLRLTRRTVLVLRAIAQVPKSSNREIAAAAGLADEGQASRLLRRLQDGGLIENVGLGQAYGEANAWRLTIEGERFMDRIKRIPNAGPADSRIAASRSARRTRQRGSHES